MADDRDQDGLRSIFEARTSREKSERAQELTSSAISGMRRTRARQLIRFAIEFYRRLLRRQVGASQRPQDNEDPFVSAAVKAGQTDPEATAARIERSLDALAHVDRNANQTTLLEAWLDDLRLARAEAVTEV